MTFCSCYFPNNDVLYGLEYYAMKDPEKSQQIFCSLRKVGRFIDWFIDSLRAILSPENQTEGASRSRTAGISAAFHLTPAIPGKFTYPSRVGHKNN